MMDLLKLFTSMEFTKPFALVLFTVTFVAIIAYVYFNKDRAKRFEEYRFIPLDESDPKIDE